MELGQVIDSPEKARRFFVKNDVLTITIPNLYNRTGLFLGRFDRKKLFNFVFSVGFDSASLANCRAWLDTFDRYRKRLVNEHVPVVANGWAEFANLKPPPRWFYVRSRDLAGLPKQFDSFVCNSFGSCVATTCVSQKVS
ncbi:MAG: hypothetical protein P8Y36_12685, partial [Alphaproteobacteria bacterium]